MRLDNGSIISAEEVKSKSCRSNFFIDKKVKSQEVITFAKNLAVMIEAGLSVSRALSVLGKQSKIKFYKNLGKYYGFC